jgi:hypothetical protein
MRAASLRKVSCAASSASAVDRRIRAQVPSTIDWYRVVMISNATGSPVVINRSSAVRSSMIA